MNIESNRIISFVKETIREYAGPKAEDVEISEHTNPIKDLGLDSMDGVDFAIAIGARFKIKIPDEINPLIDSKIHLPRSVGQIADLIRSLSIESTS